MADSPALGADGPVGVEIKSDGSKIPDDLEVLEVRIRREVNRISEAIIVLADGSIATSEFPETDGSRFKPGAEIEIAAFYGDGEPATLFEGIVVAERLRLSGDRPPRLQATCRDKAIKLSRVRKTALFADKKDSDIISAIVSDAGLSADVDATSGVARDQMQVDASDWDFVRSLADRNGLLVTLDAGTLSAKAPDLAASPVLTLTLGLDVVAFDAEVSAVPALDEVAAAGWDPAQQQLVEASASPSLSNGWGNLANSALAEVAGAPSRGFGAPVSAWPSELTHFVKARADRAVLAEVQGTCRFQGNGSVKPGDIVELKGLGDRFGGNAFVGAVRHEIEAGRWETEVGLGLADEWRADAEGLTGAAASGLVPAIGGLQIAKVMKIHEDPDSKLRIQIKLPALGGATELWARFMAPYASNGFGIEFLPEIDDEVVVAFFNDDPNDPVVLGALHSSKLKRPVDAEQENKIKTITTREQLKLSFDDVDKIVWVETPAGNKGTFSDKDKSIALEDQTGNKIEMTPSGISLNSPKDISITATGKIDLAATGDLTASGMNVTATANASLKASGSASAELSAGGSVTVQGALVKIN